MKSIFLLFVKKQHRRKINIAPVTKIKRQKKKLKKNESMRFR